MFNKILTRNKKLICEIGLFSSILYVLNSIASYSLFDGRLTAFFGIPKMLPGYADLRGLTESVGCRDDFSELLSNSCDYLQFIPPFRARPFNYTKFALDIFEKLGLDSSSTKIVGGLLGIIMIFSTLVFLFCLIKSYIKKLYISSLIIVSFPTQIAIERGNYDLIIFPLLLLLVLIVIKFLSRPNLLKLINVSALSFILTALKLYPAVGLVPWGIINLFKVKKFKWFWLSLIFSSISALLIQIEYIPQILNNNPKPFGFDSFGFLTAYQDSLSILISIIFITMKILIVSFIALMTYSSVVNYEKNNNIVIFPYTNEGIFHSIFGLTIIFIYILSNSYDYRMIFIIGLLPFYVNSWSKLPSKIYFMQIKIFPILLLFVCYQQYLPSFLFKTTSVLSDVIVQPILIGFLVGTTLTKKDKIITSSLDN